MSHTGVDHAYGVGVQNIVCTFQTGCRFNTPLLTEAVCGQLSPRRFPATVACIRMPTATLVIFENGKFLLVGTHHRMDALLAAALVMRRIRNSMHVFPRMHMFDVCNVVCSLSLGHYLDLPRFHKRFRTRSMYNPDKFDGCQYYHRNDPFLQEKLTTFVLFKTGRIVLTGCTSRRQAQLYVQDMLPVLRHFRCSKQQVAATQRNLAVLSSAKPLEASAPSYTMVAKPGPGGCLHTGVWIDATADCAWPRCGKCHTMATPRQFANRVSECEHDGQWLGDLPPICTLCGFVDVDLQYERRRQRKMSQNRKRVASELDLLNLIDEDDVPGDTPVSRVKRFKPAARVPPSELTSTRLMPFRQSAPTM